MTILDTSKWQGAISTGTFAAARAAGITRSIHKAGGSNAGRYVDSQYAHNAAAARAAGLLLGHYWFNGAGDPTADADWFVDNLVAYAAGDWLVLDIESTGTTAWSPAAALAFASRVFTRTGVKPLLYMSSSVTRAADWSPLVAFGCQLWVAQYSSSAPTVAHWPTWAAWQYTSSGTVPGIPTLVDLSHEGIAVVTAPAPADVPPTLPKDLDMLVFANSQTNAWGAGSPGHFDPIPSGQGGVYLKLANQTAPIVLNNDEMAIARDVFLHMQETGLYAVVDGPNQDQWFVIGPDVFYRVKPGEGDSMQATYGSVRRISDAQLTTIRNLHTIGA